MFEEIQYIYKGILIGLMVSVPLGPMGILLIQKTLQKGALAGFISGMGVVFADLCYSVIAAFGLGVIVDIVSTHELYFKLIGGIFLIIIGLRIYFTNPLTAHKHSKNTVTKKGLLGDFLTFFILTISNPVAIFIFMAVFAGASIFETNTLISTKMLVFTGIAIGAMGWWYLLSSLVNIFRRKIKLRTLVVINKISGAIIAVIGIFVILTVNI